jgi:hypothetical protein
MRQTLLDISCLLPVGLSNLKMEALHYSEMAVDLYLFPHATNSASYVCSSTLTMKAICSSETSVDFCQAEWSHVSEYSTSLSWDIWMLVSWDLEKSRRGRMGPPLWSSGQSSWLRPRSPGFDFRRYQIFCVAVALKRGPLSLVRIMEELLQRKNSGSGLEIWD